MALTCSQLPPSNTTTTARVRRLRFRLVAARFPLPHDKKPLLFATRRAYRPRPLRPRDDVYDDMKEGQQASALHRWKSKIAPSAF